MEYIGEIAALATAFFWSFTSLFFTAASKRIGSYWLNKIRIILAVILLGSTLFITTGRLLPDGIPAESYYYLILSGVIGLSLADTLLFRSFVMMGPRISLLVFSVSPIIAAITAWIMLGEKLGIMAILGIIVTLSGVAWVTSERSYNNGNNTSGYKISGKAILLTIGAAAGQAIGLVLAKAGMGDTLDALPATFIRMAAAAVGIWMYSIIRGHIWELPTKLKDVKALYLSLGGAVCGPFLGVWLSLAAVKHTEAGIAMAIMATVPVMVIPLVILIHKEKVSYRAVIGAVVTVGGVALLFVS